MSSQARSFDKLRMTAAGKEVKDYFLRARALASFLISVELRAKTEPNMMRPTNAPVRRLRPELAKVPVGVVGVGVGAAATVTTAEQVAVVFGVTEVLVAVAVTVTLALITAVAEPPASGETLPKP